MAPLFSTTYGDHNGRRFHFSLKISLKHFLWRFCIICLWDGLIFQEKKLSVKFDDFRNVVSWFQLLTRRWWKSPVIRSSKLFCVTWIHAGDGKKCRRTVKWLSPSKIVRTIRKFGHFFWLWYWVYDPIAREFRRFNLRYEKKSNFYKNSFAV